MKRTSAKEALRIIGSWFSAKKLTLAAVVVIVALLIPRYSEGQTVPPPGLGSIGRAITNVIGNYEELCIIPIMPSPGLCRVRVWDEAG